MMYSRSTNTNIYMYQACGLPVLRVVNKVGSSKRVSSQHWEMEAPHWVMGLGATKVEYRAKDLLGAMETNPSGAKWICGLYTS